MTLNSKISPFFLALFTIDSNYESWDIFSAFSFTVHKFIARETNSLPTMFAGKCFMSLYTKSIQSVFIKASLILSSLEI